jgi:hypothetical protein
LDHPSFSDIPVTNKPTEHWETFNRRMDALFGNDICDRSTGRLLHVKRGTFGINLVLRYFDEATSKGTLDWDLATIKVNRLVTEFKMLM